MVKKYFPPIFHISANVSHLNESVHPSIPFLNRLSSYGSRGVLEPVTADRAYHYTTVHQTAVVNTKCDKVIVIKVILSHVTCLLILCFLSVLEYLYFTA